MRRLAWVLVTAGVVLVCCAGAVVVGRASSPPDGLRRAGVWACSPACYMGVVPGETTWGTTAFGHIASERHIILHLPPDGDAGLFRSLDGATFGRMYVTLPSDTPLTAGWIVHLYGEPCGVSLYTQQGMATLRYPFMLANARLDDAPLSAFTRIYNIQFHDPAFRSQTQPDVCVDNITDTPINRAWEGFGALRRQLRDQERTG